MSTHTITANSFDVQNQTGYSVIRFFGFIDAGSVEHAKPAINAKIPAECVNLVIDLENVEFLDSHGVGFFVSLLKKMHARKGRLVFVGATAQPASVLNMVGFSSSLITYCDSMDQASAFLTQH